MKAQDAIKWLSNYDPEQEIIIAWWDKDTSGYNLTEEQWQTIVDDVDKREYCWEMATESIDEAVHELGYDTEEETN